MPRIDRFERLEKHVIDFLCELQTQARDAEFTGDVQLSIQIREFITRIFQEFQIWKANQKGE